MTQSDIGFKNREYWSEENLLYSKPYFRLEKIASIINHMSQGHNYSLLDVGCGPATLRDLLNKTITYFGIDIALHENHPNLIEMDFIKKEIRFADKKFDFVVAAGVFEYVIQHVTKPRYPTWNNIKTIKAFKSSVESFFKIERFFSSYHGFDHPMYVDGIVNKRLQMRLNINIPIISQLFGVNYIFVCSLGKNG